MSSDETSRRARALSAVLEPVAGQVYFSPECHAGYQALGFGPSPGEFGGVAMPDGPAYFCSRGSLLGDVPGEVVAAAFAVFNPKVVVGCVDQGRAITDASTIEKVRTEGSLGQLRRILGDEPDGAERAAELLDVAGRGLRVEGRSLYAGVLAREVPTSALGRTWRLADRLREYRGDSHTAAWTSAGLDAVRIGLLTELYWGLPMRSYIRTRAWSDEELDEGASRLTADGLLDGGALSRSGRALREEIERATDMQCAPIVENLGDDFDELVGLLTPMARAIREAKGYPASGPQDLAAAARSAV